MIATVGDLDFTGDPVDDFADGAFVLLVAALAKLPLNSFLCQSIGSWQLHR
jgi:hypothetical protein